MFPPNDQMPHSGNRVLGLCVQLASGVPWPLVAEVLVGFFRLNWDQKHSLKIRVVICVKGDTREGATPVTTSFTILDLLLASSYSKSFLVSFSALWSSFHLCYLRWRVALIVQTMFQLYSEQPATWYMHLQRRCTFIQMFSHLLQGDSSALTVCAIFFSRSWVDAMKSSIPMLYANCISLPFFQWEILYHPLMGRGNLLLNVDDGGRKPLLHLLPCFAKLRH